MKNMQRYDFKKFKIHLDTNFKDSLRLLENSNTDWEEAVEVFSNFFEELEKMPISTERNVKMLLATRFFNHILSSLILTLYSLYVDSVICSRTAIESLAAFKLICANPKKAESYHADNFPSPIKVRIELENLGYTTEANNIRTIYKSDSELTHITRDHERFSMDYNYFTKDGQLFVGGHFSKDDTEYMIKYLPTLIHWFLMPLDNTISD
ncbi:hypothetical protein [Methanolacinia petrolearia]|nr:hypothetical protein [Methanolacinia petrolearia]